MDVHTRHAQVQLHPARPLRLSAAKGTRLRSVGGTAWITIDNDARDLVLAPGEEWTVESDQPVLVTPLGHERVRLDLCQATASGADHPSPVQAASDWLGRLWRHQHQHPHQHSHQHPRAGAAAQAWA